MTIWKDMTDDEKGALLLACHEGKVIEYNPNGQCGWRKPDSPRFYGQHAYRVKPSEPVYRTTSQKQWVVTAPSRLPEIKNCKSSEHPSYLGSFNQVYRDGLLVEFTWRAD